MKRMLVILALAAAGLSAVSTGAAAQTDQWNALYDRIIRLEHEVRALRGVPSRGGGADARRLRALEAEVNALRLQIGARLNAFEARLRRLERARGLPAAPGPAPAPRPLPLRPRPGGSGAGLREGDLRLPEKPEFSVEYENPAPPPSARPPVVSPPPSAPSVPPAASAVPPAAPPLPGAGGPAAAPENVQAAPLDAPSSAATAAPPAADAGALLKRARDSFLRRRFGMAEASYRTFLSRFGAHPKAPQAQFELGETYYVQGRYKPAGQAYLETYKRWPRSALAPQALLRLGMSLKRLGQGRQACRTWKLLREKYPSSRAARRSAPREMKRLKCRG